MKKLTAPFLILLCIAAVAAAPKTNAPATSPPVALLSTVTNPPPVLPPPEPTVTVAQANAYAAQLFIAGAKCALAAERLYPEVRDTDGIIAKAQIIFQSQK